MARVRALVPLALVTCAGMFLGASSALADPAPPSLLSPLASSTVDSVFSVDYMLPSAPDAGETVSLVFDPVLSGVDDTRHAVDVELNPQDVDPALNHVTLDAHALASDPSGAVDSGTGLRVANPDVAVTTDPALPDGAWDVTVSYVDASRVSHSVTNTDITLDTSTAAPSLTSPVGASSSNDGTAAIALSLPEAPAAHTVQLDFVPTGGGTTRTVTLTTATAGAASFSLSLADPASDPHVENVTPAGAIPYGNYTVVLSYQDAAGHPAATSSVSDVTFAPTPTPTPTPTLTPTPAPTATPAPSPDPSPTATPEPTPSSSPAGTPAPTPTPSPTPAPDRTKPVVHLKKVSKASGRASVTVALSEPATVRLTVQRKAGRTWVTVSLSSARLPAGRSTLKLSKAAARGMRIAIVGTDAAGNVSAEVDRIL